ncbi:MAG: sugar phosphate isomerase/epimerase [Clostridia bacterium]|nr:sugar phosphate isomerase/epimerase [Clostridia bacterium]
MKISVSSYSFNQYIKKGKMTQLDCIRAAKEMGFDAIEFTDLTVGEGEDELTAAARLRAEAERVGIEINAYTVGACLYYDSDQDSEAEVARLCGKLDVAAALGASVLRHDVCYKLGNSGNSRSFDLMLPTIAENARRITKYAKSLGIRTCTENHGFVSQDSDRVERLFNAVSHDNFGLLVDIGNFLCVDEDPITAVSRLAPYAIHVHAKDFIRTEEGGITTRGANHIAGCTLGEGVVPVAQCIAILKRAGYSGYVSLEYEGSEDCIEGISRGLSVLKSLLA